jgi:chromosome partitioning protein
LPDRARPGIAEVLTGAEPLEAVLSKTRDPQLTVLTVGRVDPTTVSGFEDALARPGIVTGMLARVSGDFDITVIDCPAGLGKIATRAFEASTHVLSPLQAEPLALRSVGQLLALLDRIKAEKNPKLTLIGVVLSMFDRKAQASLEVAETLWTKFPGGIIMDTIIPRDETFLEASLRGSPLALMSKRPPPLARVFDQLASDVLDRLEPAGSAEADDGPIPLLV